VQLGKQLHSETVPGIALAQARPERGGDCGGGGAGLRGKIPLAGPFNLPMTTQTHHTCTIR